MPLSIQLFGLPEAEYRPIVERADALGFECAWLSDHIITPIDFGLEYPYTESGDPGYRPETPLVDVTVALGYLAAATERILLAAGVYVLPLRRPIDAARAWATLQNLSDGRAVLGIGVGWMREEFDAVGEEFSGRGARTDEMLDVMDLLWEGRPAEFHGDHYDFGRVLLGGAPSRPIPKVFGGHGLPALRRAAARGDGWFGPNVPLGQTVAFRDRLEALRAAAGRDQTTFTYYVRLAGGQDAGNAARYREAGFHHLVLSPFAGLGPEATLEDKLGALDDLTERLAQPGS